MVRELTRSLTIASRRIFFAQVPKRKTSQSLTAHIETRYFFLRKGRYQHMDSQWLSFGGVNIAATRIIDRTFSVKIGVPGQALQRRVGKVLGVIMNSKDDCPELLTTVGDFVGRGHIWILMSPEGEEGLPGTFDFERPG